MTEPLSAQYDPASIEAPLYREWEERGYFRGDAARVNEGAADPYVIVIPPPNVTSVLHMGHGLNNTIQDVLTRWRRMQGRESLYLPGTDHAGIATQNVVERLIAVRAGHGTTSAVNSSSSASGSSSTETGIHHPAAAARHRLLVRLVADPLHAGAGPVPRGARGLRPAVREGPDLPRQLHHQLVPALPDGAVGRGGGAAGERRQAVPPALSGGRRRAGGAAAAAGRPGVRGGCDDAAGDHAGRHGNCGSPGGRPLHRPGGWHRAAAAGGS
jgi:hypothetical protein